MQVFSQRTRFNERLCSLLSAVLQCQMHPAFTRAILQKQPAKVDSLLSVPTIVCVYHTDDLNNIGSLVPMMKRIAEHHYGFNFLWCSSEEFEEQIQALAEEPIVIVNCFTASYSINQYLIGTIEEGRLLKGLLGVVYIAPTDHLAVEFVHVPLLFVATSPASIVQRDFRVCLANPNAIIVQIDAESSYELEARDLQLARLVATFAEALHQMHRHQLVAAKSVGSRSSQNVSSHSRL